MSTPAPVSFTVRRPSPVSRGASSGPDSDGPSFKVPALPRHLTDQSDNGRSAPGSPLARSESTRSKKSASRTYDERDSSDESEGEADELITGFDQFGVQRVHEKKSQGPLVIAPLKNKDWREVARIRRSSDRFVPGAGKAATGADGSVGGLGTRDAINSGPQLSGLQASKRIKVEHDGDMDMDANATDDQPNGGGAKKEEDETEDQKALRMLLAGREDDQEVGIPAIPMRALSEAEALKQDVAELPEEASLEDYDRVPVSQFGAAMLRGMGWTPEADKTNTKTKGKRPVEPYLPAQRPALLGIGAKEKEAFDDGGPKKRAIGKKEQMKYMPLLKKEREGRETSDSGSGRERDGDRRDRRDREDRESRRERSGRDRDYNDRDRDRSRQRDRDSDGKDRHGGSDHGSRDRRIDDRRERGRDSDGKDQRRDYSYDSREKSSRRNEYDDHDRKDDRRDRDRDYDRDRSRDNKDRGGSSRRRDV